MASVGTGALLCRSGWACGPRWRCRHHCSRAGRAVFALFLGVAMCVSAIPVIAKVLLEMRLLHRDIGQLIINAAAVDDIVGWFLLAVVSAMATTGARAGALSRSALYLVGVIVVAI